jgi:folate-dependent tRNA-U54 methylase TrmFO/GidA
MRRNKAENEGRGGKEMKHEIGQWVWSFDEEVFQSSAYDTKEEVIGAAKEECDASDQFWVGQVAPVNLSTAVDVDGVLETIAISAYDEVGTVAEDYLCHVDKEDYEILEERMSKVMADWMKEFGYEPTFYKVINIERVDA